MDKGDTYEGEVVIEDRAGVAIVQDEVYALQAPPLFNYWALP